MEIEDIPSKNSLQYPIPVTIRISVEANRKLEAIKAKGKTKAQAVRSILDNYLKDVTI